MVHPFPRQDLNNIMRTIHDSYRLINYGGCGVMVSIVGINLIKLGINPEIVSRGYSRKPQIA